MAKEHLGESHTNKNGINFADVRSNSVITVHGIRDDTKTAWTSKDPARSEIECDWLQEELFTGLDIRQLDYAYGIEESDNIFHTPDGIDVEARKLLDCVAQARTDLPEVRI